MQIKIKAPVFPESVADGTIVNWHKKPGDSVQRDEALVDIETEKVVLEVPAPEDGVLQELIKKDGSIVTSNEAIAILETSAKAASPASKVAVKAGTSTLAPEPQQWNLRNEAETATPGMGPAARHLVSEHGIDPNTLSGTGKDGRLTKQDVLEHLQQQKTVQSDPASTASAPQTRAPKPTSPDPRGERREPMSRLRATIADRLVQAQHNAALLSTFNEVNMQSVMTLRSEYKQRFQEQHGVKLGLMSFFVKAVIDGLQQFPVVNASIDSTDIVYHDYYDIGIAVSSPRGLVVPILRDADGMSFADIETTITDFGSRAKESRLSMEQLTGGTFTITNGGVFGSLLSAPIVNPPQSAILAMHKIQERPIAEDGEVCIRPMMYLALSYDHRLIDGRDAVQFLVTVKEALENPARLMLEI